MSNKEVNVVDLLIKQVNFKYFLKIIECYKIQNLVNNLLPIFEIQYRMRKTHQLVIIK